MTKTLSVEEGNKLIAEFMGWESGRFSNLPNKLHKMDGGYLMGISIDQLEYHSSWDWLMPVVEKIESLHNCVFSFFIVQDECDIGLSTKYRNDGEDWDAPKFEQKCGSKIKSTYAAVIQFIQWYKTQPAK